MNNDNFTELHTFPREQIIFLSMTLFKPVASSSEKKVADFSEQRSRRVSSVVAGSGLAFQSSVWPYGCVRVLGKSGGRLGKRFGGKMAVVYCEIINK